MPYGLYESKSLPEIQESLTLYKIVWHQTYSYQNSQPVSYKEELFDPTFNKGPFQGKWARWTDWMREFCI
jgi:hypothetical protein